MGDWGASTDVIHPSRIDFSNPTRPDPTRPTKGDSIQILADRFNADQVFAVFHAARRTEAALAGRTDPRDDGSGTTVSSSTPLAVIRPQRTQPDALPIKRSWCSKTSDGLMSGPKAPSIHCLYQPGAVPQGSPRKASESQVEQAGILIRIDQGYPSSLMTTLKHLP